MQKDASCRAQQFCSSIVESRSEPYHLNSQELDEMELPPQCHIKLGSWDSKRCLGFFRIYRWILGKATSVQTCSCISMCSQAGVHVES